VSADESHRPVLRVISGDATDEEIAVILALVGARRQAVVAEELARESVSVWSGSTGSGHRRARAVPEAHRHGWRTSYWPS